MGMFDTIRCEHPLPDLEDSASMEFQTKSMYSHLESYLITKAGRLVLVGGFGPGRGRDLDVQYHGMLNFYGTKEQQQGYNPENWYEYNAKFTDGTLVNVERVKRTANETHESGTPAEHQGVEREDSKQQN